jgi:hypothetical protein
MAETWEGLQVKAVALSWCHSGEQNLQLTKDQPTDIRLAQSIIRDLIG